MCVLQVAGLGRVEQGATWLHGLDGSPVYEAALAAGLMSGQERRVAGARHCRKSDGAELVSCYAGTRGCEFAYAIQKAARLVYSLAVV